MRHPGIIVGAFGIGCVLAVALYVNEVRRVDRTEVWHPGDSSTIVDPLYPPGRLEPASGGEQVMTQEPVYTDIRHLRRYRRITLAVIFENPDTIPVSMGFRTADGGMDLVPAGPGRFEATFDVSRLRVAEGRLQAIVSAPELREGAKPLVIRELTVTYHK